VITESFSTGHSPLHRMDPRVRVLTAVLYAFIIALCQEETALFIALAVSASLVIAANLNPLAILRRLMPLSGFLLFLFAAVPLTFGGEAMGHILGLSISTQGVWLCIRISLKSVAILLSFFALITTMPMTVLGHSLDRLRVPGKLIHLLLVTYRYLFVFEAEFQRLIRAAKIRGFQPSTTIHTYRTYAFMVAMLFVRASHRGDRVFNAMKCRGFDGRFYSLWEFATAAGDKWFAAAMTLCCICILWVEWHPPAW
jgi:cobalt/nickel transport system permease protein